ncbi:hypothetical protein [Chloroflexus islandicus]|uniref:hypothetical protein n=1 Tax=Chloroflexus islandicus TaxID=1707952 RepID=UPI001FDFFA8C|nr:hypothetical protein [Chloroflexus islandicus]
MNGHVQMLTAIRICVTLLSVISKWLHDEARKPRDDRDAILRMGELGVLPPDFAIQ